VALLYFAGLILFNFFFECVSRAPTLLLENVAYIKKVVFPLEICPGCLSARRCSERSERDNLVGVLRHDQ